MGNLLIAHCPCGFKHSAGVGGGFLNHDTIDNEPALCPACDNFSIQNYIAKNHGCAKCGSRVVFYNDPSLMADPSKAVLPGSPVALPDGLEPIHYWAAHFRIPIQNAVKIVGAKFVRQFLGTVKIVNADE